MADDLTTGTLMRELALLPIIGFVLALCYEGAFFFFLDIELRQVLTLTDIVEASALKILPAIPFLFIGAWVGSSDPLPQAANNRQRVRNFFLSGPEYFIKLMVYFSAGMYFLFGVGAQFGFVASVLVIVGFIGRIAIFPALRDLSRKTVVAVWFVVVITVIFFSMGQSDAHSIRMGDRSDLPFITSEKMTQDTVVDELRLVRRLSSGVLVTATTGDRLWFIANDGSSILTFKMDTTPFRGVLCGGLGWCPSYLNIAKTHTSS